MTDLDMMFNDCSHAPHWQTMETIDLDVLRSRRRIHAAARRLVAVVLALVLFACALGLGASRLRHVAVHGVTAPAALQVALPPAPGT